MPLGFVALTTEYINEAVTDNTNLVVSEDLAIPATSRQLYNNLSTGILTGGTCSINADLVSIDVTAGTGIIVDNSTDTTDPTITEISWAAQNVPQSFFATQLVTTIAINASGVAVELAGAGISGADFRQRINLYLVLNNSTIYTGLSQFASPAVDVSATTKEFISLFTPANITGNIYSANGANLQLDRSAGVAFDMGSNWFTSQLSPNRLTSLAQSPVPGINFVWRDGAGGWNISFNNPNVLPGRYDDGTGGASQPNGVVGPTLVTVQRVYFFPALGITGIAFGQTTHTAIILALIDFVTEDFIANETISSNAVFRGYLFVIGGATDLSNVAQARFVTAQGVKLLG